MKKIYLIVALFATNAINAQNVVGFESVTLDGPESYWDGSDYSGSSNGSGLFDSIFELSNLEFNNQYDTTWGASWGYWSSGWAFSNLTPAQVQLGAYYSSAGGASSGNNFASGKMGSEIVVTNGVATINAIDVCNTSYAWHSMTYGDSFAKQFGSTNGADGQPDGTNGEDWFLLTIVGYDLQDNVKDSVEFYLADYRFANSSEDYILDAWQTVTLSQLGSVHKLEFKLSSSDVGQWGMNTPAFFAIDNVSYGAVGVNELSSSKVSVYPNPGNGVINIENAMDKEISIVDLTGKTLVKRNISSEKETLDLSYLAKGVYSLVIASDNRTETQKIIIE